MESKSSSAVRPPRVAIVGAGVVGLSVGVCLSESRQPLDLTVIADRFSPHTTSDRAGGLIVPYTIGVAEYAVADIKRWSFATFEYFKALFESGDREEIGLSIVDCFERMKTELPWWKDVVFDFEVIDPKDATTTRIDINASRNGSEGIEGSLSFDSRADHGTASSREELERFDAIQHSYFMYALKTGQKVYKYKAFVVEGRRYLPWLMRKFQENRGLVEKRRICSLSELKSYDLVINCTGIEARDLTGDTLLHPIRGQIVTVKSSRVREFLDFGKPPDGKSDILPYVIPHHDIVLLGGTALENDWSTSPDPETAHMIYKKCVEYCPSLEGSKVVGGWACLRPARESVRLELDESHDNHVIHCYGHGGQGYVLHWGCARDVEKIVKEFFNAKVN